MNETSTYVLYYGLNGYGITLFFLGINILIFFVSIAAIFLNGAIIYILFRRHFREDISCIFISNLALSDFLSGILLFYNVVYNLIHYKIFYECAFRFGMVNGVFMNSSVTLLALTSERYAKIMLPYRYERMVTPRRVKWFTSCSWFICIVACQAPIFGWNQDTSEEYCRYFGVFTKPFLLAYSGIMYTMSFLVCMMYCHILYIAYKQSIRITQGNNKLHNSHKYMWWRPTKTALIIVGVNVVSWLPSGIYVSLASTDHLDHLSMGQKGTILTYISSIIYLNCIANPLIYASKIKKVSRFIRKAFKLRDKANYITDFELKCEHEIEGMLKTA